MESRQIKDFEDYTIYANGFIINRHGKFLKPGSNKDGYLFVVLYKNGKTKQNYVHRLVCEAFHDNPGNKRCVDHIDHDRQNNWKSNLRWVTDSENCKNKPKQENTLFRGVTIDKTNNTWKSKYIDKEGKQKNKSFSINKYGNKQALRLAVEARYNAELLYDYTILQTPTQFFQSDVFINISD